MIVPRVQYFWRSKSPCMNYISVWWEKRWFIRCKFQDNLRGGEAVYLGQSLIESICFVILFIRRWCWIHRKWGRKLNDNTAIGFKKRISYFRRTLSLLLLPTQEKWCRNSNVGYHCCWNVCWLSQRTRGRKSWKLYLGLRKDELFPLFWDYYLFFVEIINRVKETTTIGFNSGVLHTNCDFRYSRP